MRVQFRMEPGQMMQESYTVEEDPLEAPPVVSVETSEDGTTRRTETTVRMNLESFLLDYVRLSRL